MNKWSLLSKVAGMGPFFQEEIIWNHKPTESELIQYLHDPIIAYSLIKSGETTKGITTFYLTEGN